MPHNQQRRVLTLPDALRRKALAAGDVGHRWIADLDAILAEVAAAWELEIGGEFARSSQSLVLRVRLADGTRAVLKVGLPGIADLGREAHVCSLADGHVLPRVLAHHLEHNALLLEALGRPIGDLGWPMDVRFRAICRTVQALWRTPTTGAGLGRGSRKAHWLREFIEEKWRSLQAPCEVATRDRALEFAAERADAHRDDASVFVHGDAHGRNTLTLLDGSEAPGAECRMIDPQGLHAEPACDLAVPMRGQSRALRADPVGLGRERCAWLAECTGVDERAIWQWGFVARVSTGLLLQQIGRTHEAALVLGIADAWARVPPP